MSGHLDFHDTQRPDHLGNQAQRNAAPLRRAPQRQATGVNPSTVADNRDIRRPKTPPPGVRAQTARSEDTAKEIAELKARLEELEGAGVPEHEIEDFEAATPIHVKKASPEVQQQYRAKRASAQVNAMRGTIGEMEDDIIKQLLLSEVADRREREQRAETARIQRESAQQAKDHADAAAARELKASSAAARAKIILYILGIISALLAGAGVRGQL